MRGYSATDSRKQKIVFFIMTWLILLKVNLLSFYHLIICIGVAMCNYLQDRRLDFTSLLKKRLEVLSGL